jgi:hypothetical protein
MLGPFSVAISVSLHVKGEYLACETNLFFALFVMFVGKETCTEKGGTKSKTTTDLRRDISIHTS